MTPPSWLNTCWTKSQMQKYIYNILLQYVTLRQTSETACWGGLTWYLISKALTLLSLYCYHSFSVLTLLKGKPLNLQRARHLTPINHNTPFMPQYMPGRLTFMIPRVCWKTRDSAAELRFSMASCRWSALRPIPLRVSERLEVPMVT